MVIFYVFLSLFLCSFVLEGESKNINSEKRYEYIDLLSDNKCFKDKLQKIKNRNYAKEHAKNKYVFAYCGSSGSNKRKLLKNLFDISNDSEKDFINLGFKQTIDIWFGNDKKGNANIILDIDLLENFEIFDDDDHDDDHNDNVDNEIDNDTNKNINNNNNNNISSSSSNSTKDVEKIKRWGHTIYNFDKLVEFVLENTNSILIPLEKEDIIIEPWKWKGDTKIKEENKKISNRNITNQYLKKDIERNDIERNDIERKEYERKEYERKEYERKEYERKEYERFRLPRKTELFLEKINKKGKNANVYFILMGEQKNNCVPSFINWLEKEYRNLQFYVIKEDQLHVDMLQKKNKNRYDFLLNNIEHILKKLVKEIKTFQNLDSYNNKCVYNLYVIEEAYAKCVDYFDHIYNIYEEQIVKGNIIKNYGSLSKRLVYTSLSIFNLLTLEQTGTNLKKNIIRKLSTRFKNSIKKQILKQLLLLETFYINKAKQLLFQKNFQKQQKIIGNKQEQIVDLKTKLIKEMKKEIDNITSDQFQSDLYFENVVEEFVDQFQIKLEHVLTNYYNLMQSPLKRLFDKKKLKETIYKKRKYFFTPSVNMNLTLTSLIRKSGYGNLQSYLVYDLGLLTFVFGLLNDRDSPDVLQQTKEIPFFKFQPKLNVKVDWNQGK